MATLSFGLNTPKASQSKLASSAPAKRRPVFGGDDDSDAETHNAPSEPQPKRRKPSSPPSKPPTSSLSKDSTTARAGAADIAAPNLASQRTQKLVEEQTASLDPSVYDYDSAYDALHLARDAAKKKPADASANQSRYMGNLLAAAETRKRDYERAQDKLLQREREAEGDEFADKEKFVTEAYKAAQEERRKQEAADKQREEEEARKRKEKGMAGFYKGVMEDEERRHREQMEAVEMVRRGEVVLDEEEEKVKTAEQLAKEMNEQGAKIALDAEGMVADKRQLLKGGLNVALPSKSKQRADEQKAKDSQSRPMTQEQRAGLHNARSAKEAQRERQTRMIEHQLEQAQKQAAQQEAEDQEKKQVDAKSRKTKGEISSAKERYLQRKREREEEAKKEKQKGKG